MNDSSLPRPKRRWIWFSLLAVLLAVLLVSIPVSWLGVKMNQARKQRAAAEAIEDAGGVVVYYYESSGPPRPPRARKSSGDDFLDVVVEVRLPVDAGDAELEHVAELPYLESLHLSHTQITDTGLKHLQGLTALFILELEGTQITDAGLEHLRGLTNLRMLDVEGTLVTDEGLDKLQEALPDCTIYHMLMTRVYDPRVWEASTPDPGSESDETPD